MAVYSPSDKEQKRINAEINAEKIDVLLAGLRADLEGAMDWQCTVENDTYDYGHEAGYVVTRLSGHRTYSVEIRGVAALQESL